MPNWCSNEVTMFGDAEVIKEIVELMNTVNKDNPDESNAFDFNNLLPTPEDIGDEWYQWRVDNWGTKWNSVDTFADTTEDPEYIWYNFDTAWAPAKGIYEELTKRYPSVGIGWFYREPGVEIAGYLNND